MEMTGSVSGMLELLGGGSNVSITPTLAAGTKIADYEIDSTPGELYAPTPEALTAAAPLVISSGVISIDLSGYQEKLTAGSYITIDSDNEISCNPPITNVWYTPEPDVQQDILIGKFTVNDVTQNVYAPAGGGGGSLDLPTDGSPVAIGTFGNMTLYAQSVSVAANNYALSRFWTGQAGDIVLSANAIAVANVSNNVKMVVPSSITNIVSFSWYTDDYEALPHISIYSTLDSNFWSNGATIKGMVIFAR